MSSRVCFVHPSRPSPSGVFYVTLTAEQAENMQKVGRADASARYPFFALKEQKEHGSEKADVEEGAAAEDGVAVVAIEISMRGVCTLWPHWLQCDTMNHYRLRGCTSDWLITTAIFCINAFKYCESDLPIFMILAACLWRRAIWARQKEVDGCCAGC